MTQQDHSPLGDAIATLRKAPEGPHRGMLPAALHTLITAILTRLFARLEAILRLWQAGECPAPRHQTSTRQDSARAPQAAPRKAQTRRRTPRPNQIVGRVWTTPPFQGVFGEEF